MKEAYGGREISIEVARGRSVLRALANVSLRGFAADLHGTVLDLASGDASSAARSLAPDSTWVGVDISHHPDIIADATGELPLRDGSFNAAICLWFLYMAFEPIAVLREVRRVLRPRGALILGVPLVFAVHPEPRDLWRFTPEGISYVLEEAGFDEISTAAVGGRATSALYLLEPFIRPRRLFLPAASRAALTLDRWSETRGLASCPAAVLARGVA